MSKCIDPLGHIFTQKRENLQCGRCGEEQKYDPVAKTWVTTKAGTK